MTTITELINEIRDVGESAFQRVAWVESRIAHYSAEYPERTPWLFDCFKYGYTGVPSVIYEHDHAWSSHVETMIRRVAKKHRLERPTHPMMLFALSRISESIPLHGDTALLFRWLFADVFPEYADELNLQPLIGIPMPDECRYYYTELVNRCVMFVPKPDPQRYWGIYGKEGEKQTTEERKPRQLRLRLF